MITLRRTVHRSADSRVTDGGRLYWKKTAVFQWQKKKGKRDISTHYFFLSYWPDVKLEEAVDVQ